MCNELSEWPELGTLSQRVVGEQVCERQSSLRGWSAQRETKVGMAELSRQLKKDPWKERTVNILLSWITLILVIFVIIVNSLS